MPSRDPVPDQRAGGAEPPPRRRWRPSRTDVVVAAVVALVGAQLTWPPTATYDLGSPALTGALAATEAVPLLWRRRAPLAVFATTVGLSWVTAAVPGSAFTPMIAAVVATYTVASLRPTAQAAAAAGFAALAAPLVVRVALATPFPFEISVGAGPEAVIDAFAGAAATFAGVTVLGVTLQARRRYIASLAERTRQLEREREERARRAVLEERARIARELHDVAAHHLSGLVLQAGALERTVERDPERARELASEVRQGGATALSSMRRLVGLLRAADDEHDGRGSQPSLSDLSALVEDARGDGLDVSLDADADYGEVPDEVQLAAYRIVQESLSNVRRHAPGASVRVAIGRDGAGLGVEVRDDGGSAAAQGAGDGEPGHGLIGMRERADVLGGTLDAGPQPDGGWRVRARLPLEAEE